MDSITHLFIGGAIAAALAPPAQRRAALLAGAALNSLPDLDVLPLLLTDDPVIRMTWHSCIMPAATNFRTTSAMGSPARIARWAGHRARSVTRW